MADATEQHPGVQSPLTPRQLEIFNLMAKGLSNREICEMLGISNNTVKIHVAAILRNLNVSNRTEAVFLYREMLTTEPTPANSEQTRRIRMVDRIGRPTIAVLPFTDLSGQRSDDYLVEGIVEELSVSLSAWRWFPVISYSSSWRYCDAEHTYSEVGRQLGASYLIAGTLRRNADDFRVTAKLLAAESGEISWSRTFDLPAADLFELQYQIAAHIVRSLAPELLDDQARNLPSETSGTFSAWEHACRGLWHLNRGGREDATCALECFDAALERDPSSCFALNGRVCVRQKQLYEQWTDDPRETVVAVVKDAERCLQLDPRASHSHANVGLAAILQGRRDAALKHLETAVHLNPNSTRALVLLAQAYGMSGRIDEAIMHLEDLLRIDPHSPSAHSYRNILGMCHFVLGNYDEAIEWARSAIALRPNVSGAYLSLTAALTEKGLTEQARETVRALFAQIPDFKLKDRLDMMRPFTEERLLTRLCESLAKVGLTE